MTSTTTTHTGSAAVARPASEPGALDCWEARCTCGFVATNSLGAGWAEADLRSHLAWAAARAKDAARAAKAGR